MKYLLLPPGSLIILALAGLLLAARFRRFGLTLIIAAVLSLWVVSTPYFATRTLSSLQSFPALAPDALLPESGTAIVVLSAAMRPTVPESDSPLPGMLTLDRLRYGAHLKRRSGLPILLSGGVIGDKSLSISQVMADSLERDFSLTADWLETKSYNTQTNAAFSAPILKKNDIDNVLLVTHAWHMPRARESFMRFGLKVTPAPMGFAVPSDPAKLQSWIPNASALAMSSFSAHEWIGLLWYRFYYDYARAEIIR